MSELETEGVMAGLEETEAVREGEPGDGTPVLVAMVEERRVTVAVAVPLEVTERDERLSVLVDVEGDNRTK